MVPRSYKLVKKPITSFNYRYVDVYIDSYIYIYLHIFTINKRIQPLFLRQLNAIEQGPHPVSLTHRRPARQSTPSLPFHCQLIKGCCFKRSCSQVKHRWGPVFLFSITIRNQSACLVDWMLIFPVRYVNLSRGSCCPQFISQRLLIHWLGRPTFWDSVNWRPKIIYDHVCIYIYVYVYIYNNIYIYMIM